MTGNSLVRRLADMVTIAGDTGASVLDMIASAGFTTAEVAEIDGLLARGNVGCACDECGFADSCAGLIL